MLKMRAKRGYLHNMSKAKIDQYCVSNYAVLMLKFMKNVVKNYT